MHPSPRTWNVLEFWAIAHGLAPRAGGIICIGDQRTVLHTQTHSLFPPQALFGAASHEKYVYQKGSIITSRWRLVCSRWYWQLAFPTYRVHKTTFPAAAAAATDIFLFFVFCFLPVCNITVNVARH